MKGKRILSNIRMLLKRELKLKMLVFNGIFSQHFYILYTILALEQQRKRCLFVLGKNIDRALPVFRHEGSEGEHHDSEARRGRDQRQPEEDLSLEAAKLTDVVHNLVIVQTDLLGVFAAHI